MAISGAKKKRVSKNSKLSWRKYTKVADVEEFLEEQREDERLGAPLQILSDEQLFVVDKTPQHELLSSREKRKLKAKRPLKGFSALQPYTKVADPIVKRNRVRTREQRKSKFIEQKEKANIHNNIMTPKERSAIEERRLDEIRRENKEKRGEFIKDLWSSDKAFSIEKDIWIDTNIKKHNLRHTGYSIKRVTKDLQQKKSALPAVELPHPGMSYNPSFKDHQDLLKIVADEEIKIIKEDAHLTRVTRGMFRKVTQDKKQTEWIVEMSEGLPINESNKVDETNMTEDEDLDKISINPPVKNKKKSLKQRRKQREQLELEKQRKAIKLEKKKAGDVNQLKFIQKKLEKAQRKCEKLRELKKVRTEKNKNKPKILSSTKFEDLGLEFQIGQDITGNLRSLKKEGNLLEDRFKSLQKRNILEPSKRAYRKKPKVKKYVKPGHKDDWEKTIARKSKLTK